MANFYGDDGEDGVSSDNDFSNYYGGDGNDFLEAIDTNNELYGGTGNDVLVGGNFLTFSGDGSPGAPVVLTSFAASGSDYLEGGTGDDILYGADGNDTIFGGSGNESGVVAGNFGTFFQAGLFGGDGNDY